MNGFGLLVLQCDFKNSKSTRELKNKAAMWPLVTDYFKIVSTVTFLVLQTGFS